MYYVSTIHLLVQHKYQYNTSSTVSDSVDLMNMVRQMFGIPVWTNFLSLLSTYQYNTSSTVPDSVDLVNMVRQMFGITAILILLVRISDLLNSKIF